MTKYLILIAAIALAGCSSVRHTERKVVYVDGVVKLCSATSCYAEEGQNKEFQACMAKGSVVSRCLRQLD